MKKNRIYLLIVLIGIIFLPSIVRFHSIKAVDDEILPWGVDYINAERVWGGTEGATSIQFGRPTGKGVNVAIIDDGLAFDHPDINDNYKGGYDFVNNDTIPEPATAKIGTLYFYGTHGTKCAGVIAAEANGEFLIGVAPEVSIYMLNINLFDYKPEERGFYPDYELWCYAIQWCIDTHTDTDPNNDIDIISMSLVRNPSLSSTTLIQKCQDAYNSGILLIASSGNDDSDVGCPANLDCVIAVGAILDDNSLWRPNPGIEGSNTGVELELVAPTEVFSLGFNDLNTNPVYHDQFKFGGTSAACPHVSGLAALIWSAQPFLTNEQIRECMQVTATDLGATGRDDYFGYGLINAEKALLDSDGDGFLDYTEEYVTYTDKYIYNIDTDGDLYSDIWELTHNFNLHDETDTLVDWDSDGLTNAREIKGIYAPFNPGSNADGFIVNLSPFNPDCDSDGFLDSEEINFNTNPFDSNSKPNYIITDDFSTDNWVHCCQDPNYINLIANGFMLIHTNCKLHDDYSYLYDEGITSSFELKFDYQTHAQNDYSQTYIGLVDSNSNPSTNLGTVDVISNGIFLKHAGGSSETNNKPLFYLTVINNGNPIDTRISSWQPNVWTYYTIIIRKIGTSLSLEVWDLDKTICYQTETMELGFEPNLDCFYAGGKYTGYFDNYHTYSSMDNLQFTTIGDFIVNDFSNFWMKIDEEIESTKLIDSIMFRYLGGGGTPSYPYARENLVHNFYDCTGDFYVEVTFDSSVEKWDIWYIYLDVGYYDEGTSSYYRKAKIRTIDHWAYNWGYYQTYGPTSNHQHGTQGVVGATEIGNKMIIKRENGILICEIIDSNSGVHYIQNYGVYSGTINAISLDFMSHNYYYSGTSSVQFYNLYASFEI